MPNKYPEDAYWQRVPDYFRNQPALNTFLFRSRKIVSSLPGHDRLTEMLISDRELEEVFDWLTEQDRKEHYKASAR